MARKSGNPEERHARRMTIRFTEEQFESIERDAHAAGIAPSAYVRQLALGCDVRVERPIVLDASGIRPAVVQLARVGNNLNQIAHRLNRGEAPGDSLRRETSGALAEVREAARKLTSLAGGMLPKRRA